MVSPVPAGPAPSFCLGPSFPNPFNPATTIFFHLEEPAAVSISVFDITGRKIRSLVESRPLSAGPHRIVWDGCNSHGRTVSSGTYLAVAKVGNEQKVLKLTLIK